MDPLNILTPAQIKAVRIHRELHYSWQEIADMFGLPASTLYYYKEALEVYDG